MGWMLGATCFHLLQNVQTDSGGHTVSRVATRGSSLQGKVATVWGSPVTTA